MNKQWSVLKNIISNNEIRKDIFLSLIDEEGNIVSANANMLKTLHLKSPKEAPGNFFNLLHPDHIDLFRKTIKNSKEVKGPIAAELYLKNGYYHPMKWQVNYLDGKSNGDLPNYLCVGYKLVDDERLRQINKSGEKNYQLIVEGLNAGILFQDAKGELVSANKKAADVLGTTLERLYQLNNIEKLWNSSWKVKTECGKPVSFNDAPFMKALMTGKTQSEVLVVKLCNGEEAWIMFNSQPLFDAGENSPYSVVTNIVDVTREKKLTFEVRERDILFRSFLDKTPNLAWVLDEKATLLFASRSFYHYFGVNENQADYRNIFDIVPNVVADALYEKHMHVMRTGEPVDGVEKAKWTDGTELDFHVNIFPIETDSGKRLIGGHAVNLSDKYAVEKKLRQANERLLLLSRTTSDAIWEWDMQTGYIFRNDTLMDMMGYHEDNSKGLSWWLRRIHPHDRDRVTDKIKDAVDNGQQTWKDEYRFKCEDGRYIHIQDKGFVVYENGLPVKMIGSLQDVTDLKSLENQLTEEKLQRQKEISETVIRVQEKERTRIGHELHDNVNQILSTVKLFVDMLKPVSQEEKVIKGKSIEYLMTAIEEIRKLSKELVVPQLKDVGLVDSIKQLIEDLQLAGTVRIKFTHDHENDLMSHGKKITIFRIIQEQMKNILKYSKAKQVDIFLQCRDNDAELVIKDDGIGFNPKQTRSGIGISNIHDRVRFYDGTVDIESSPGNGCTLKVTIPCLN
jgi:PAS domain S-box-containing protein